MDSLLPQDTEIAAGWQASQAAASTANAEADKAAAKAKHRGRIILALGAKLLLGAGWYGYEWLTVGRFQVETDDAYVAASSATLTPKIGGTVRTIEVEDHAPVAAGTPLVVLDDADFRIALAQAEAQIATQQAGIERLGRQIQSGLASVQQAEAQLASARAGRTNARAQFGRVDALNKEGYSTGKDLDVSRASRQQAEAGVSAAEAAVHLAIANVATLDAQQEEARRVLAQHQIARQQALLNLAHTVIRAPFDGVIGNRAAEPGEYVTPGQRLLAVVPLQDAYVDANFKETQLERLRPGQKARVHVDAFPDRIIEGRVESVSPASGSVFSLLPPDNATGNFTKITQRVPVRIRLPREILAQGLIRPGMSVVAEIDTRDRPAEQLASRQ